MIDGFGLNEILNLVKVAISQAENSAGQNNQTTGTGSNWNNTETTNGQPAITVTPPTTSTDKTTITLISITVAASLIALVVYLKKKK